MALKEYKKKRDFKKTAEPAGKEHVVRKKGLVFTIQKHEASRLHFDLRLEMEGVLRSWAVPKGPSLDPKQRRLAMQVEDHPMEYGDFEGTIPQGEYGGGTVMLWDEGEYSLQFGDDPVEEWNSGNMKVTFHGKRIQGNWALIRMKADSSGKFPWLMIKEKDDFAEYAPKKDLVDQHVTSVKTGRSMDEIAEGAGSKGFSKAETQRVWESNRKETSAGSKRNNTIASAKAERPAKSLKKGASLPAEKIKPQLAVLGTHTPAGDKYIHEVKYDGYRVMAYLGDSVELITRGGKDWTHKFGGIRDALGKLGLSGTILDGEIVALDDSGKTNFQLLQNHLRDAVPEPLVYYAFDILYDAGTDVRQAPVLDRKARLEEILSGKNDTIRYSEHFESAGQDVLDQACKLGLEGIISKAKIGKYHSTRHNDWVKSKCTKREEFVILGYTPPKGARTGFGALLLGTRERKSDPLTYAGKVGTGFSQASIRELLRDLKPLHTSEIPLPKKPTVPGLRQIQWLEPKLICEIAYTEMTSDGRLRHPSFMGLREDKSAGEITKEVAVQVPDKPAVKSKGKEKVPPAKAATAPKIASAKSAGAAKDKPPAKAPAGKKSKAERVDVGGVSISSADRVLYPETGETKLDLARYYEQVWPRMQPHLKGRPITLVRCPDGHSKPCFYQRHPNHISSPGVEPVGEKTEKGETNLAVSKLEGLMTLIQFGTLEIHGWQSAIPDLDAPDQIVLDLDPDEAVSQKAIVDAAVDLKALLEKCGLVPFVKSTGGKGLHVVCPLKPGASWAEVREFTEAIARALAAARPDEFVAVMSKAKRKGKIFIDYLRNMKEASAVMPYSTRAREGGTVSVPLSWEELTPKFPFQKLAMKDAIKRLKLSDPWKDFDKKRKPLNLEKLLKQLSA